MNKDNLEPILEAQLQQAEKIGGETHDLLNNVIEAEDKTREAVDNVAKAVSDLKPEIKGGEELVGIMVKALKEIKQGDPGKDADETKVGNSVLENLWERVRPLVPTVAAVKDAVLATLRGDKSFIESLKGKDAKAADVAALLKADQAFLEASKGDPGQDATSPTPEAVAAILEQSEAFQAATRGADGTEITGDQIIDKINFLPPTDGVENIEPKLISIDRVGGWVDRVRALITAAVSSKTYSISEMDDARIGTPSNGDVLTYSSDLQKWIPSPPTGGSSTNFVVDEVPSGSINGVDSGGGVITGNNTFTLAHTPTLGSQAVYLNGMRQIAGTDYTISGAVITFTNVPVTGSILLVDYRY